MLDEFDIDCEDKKVIIEEKHYILRCIPIPYFRSRFSTLSKKNHCGYGIARQTKQGNAFDGAKSQRFAWSHDHLPKMHGITDFSK